MYWEVNGNFVGGANQMSDYVSIKIHKINKCSKMCCQTRAWPDHDHEPVHKSNWLVHVHECNVVTIHFNNTRQKWATVPAPWRQRPVRDLDPVSQPANLFNRGPFFSANCIILRFQTSGHECLASVNKLIQRPQICKA